MAKPQHYRVLGWDEVDLTKVEIVGAFPPGFDLKKPRTLADLQILFTPAIEIFLDDRGVEIGTGKQILASHQERVVKVR